MTRLILTLIALALLSSLGLSKRAAPATVPPVVHEGIRYVAPNNDGRRGYIEAWDIQTNKKLWDLTVFANRIDPTLEEDVQWVFIQSLGFRDGVLVVTTERGERYQIDLKTKAVTPSDHALSPSPAAVHDIPEPVQRAIANGPLAKKYEVSFHMNPFYLRGDFNGDGKVDVAVLLKERSTGKVEIAVVDGVTNKVRVLGAATTVGNGGDDFAWMDRWEVRSKSGVVAGTSTPKLRGDALLVSKSEAASAQIYWNGKRFVWLQQGD